MNKFNVLVLTILSVVFASCSTGRIATVPSTPTINVHDSLEHYSALASNVSYDLARINIAHAKAEAHLVDLTNMLVNHVADSLYFRSDSLAWSVQHKLDVSAYESSLPKYTEKLQSLKDAQSKKLKTLPKKGISSLRYYISNMDSAGGVDFRLYGVNASNKTIKYVYVVVAFKNSVDDIVSWLGKSSFTLKDTGPYAPGETFGGLWEHVMYNYSASHSIVRSIKIQYMDGTTTSISSKEASALDDYYYFNSKIESDINAITSELHSLESKASTTYKRPTGGHVFTSKRSEFKNSARFFITNCTFYKNQIDLAQSEVVSLESKRNELQQLKTLYSNKKLYFLSYPELSKK